MNDFQTRPFDGLPVKEWEKTGGVLRVDIRVPPNTSAIAILPGQRPNLAPALIHFPILYSRKSFCCVFLTSDV
jgi:hypothetical protein